jgi:hypothetical protein
VGIYRGRRRRGPRVILAIAIVLVLGTGILWAMRQSTAPPAPPPDPIQRLIGALEIVPVSYEGAVRDGAIIAGRDVQYRGAQDALARARALFGESRDALARRSPAAVAAVEDGLRDLEAGMRAFEAPAEIRRRTERVTGALGRLPPPKSGA